MTGDAMVKGKSGKDYFFQALTIDNENDCFPVNIFLFAKLFKYANTGEHEWVLTNKSEATYKLCLLSDPNVDKEFIINDLKEDDVFKLQIDYVKN